MGVYLITGAGRGIGFALARRLLARGDRVIGSVRDGRPPLADPNFSTVSFDVRDPAAIEAAAAGMDGPIDVLVNNAGIAGPQEPRTDRLDPEAFSEVLDVNVLGPLRVTRAFLPLLGRSDNPRVMTISSQLGGMTHPLTDHVAYCTSKAAVNKLMQGLAADLKRQGIAVVIAHPGWVRTDMGGRSAMLDPDESAAGLVDLLDSLTLATTGRFMDWNGRPRAW